MKRILLASVCAMALPAVSALAQTAPIKTAPAQAAAAAAAADASDRNEIIVTATKRNQVLSDVPISVSAVSAEQLKNSGGSDIRQLNQLAPSLLVSSATSESSGVARIRGIGTVGENPGLESSVAVFIDGVYRSRTGVGLTELGEIDRVEVLRGPQGTLFGRNASSGLINIVTKKPSFTPAGTAEVSYGNFNYWRLAGSLTGGVIADKLAFRLDGVYVKRDGFLTDVISGRTLANRDRYLFRGQLLFTPTDDLSIRVIGDYNHKSEECCGASFLAPAQNLAKVNGEVIALPNSILAVERALGAIINLPTDGSKYVRQTSITPGFNYNQNSKDYGLSAEANWDLGGVSLASISGYRVYDSRNGQDGDFNNLDILRRTAQTRKFETFSQELRLQGKAFNDRVDFLVGGYYAHEKLTVTDDIKYGADYERYANCVVAEGQARGLGIPSLLNTADTSCFNRAVAATIPSATIKGLAGLSPLGAGGFDPRGGYYNVAAAIGYVPPAGQSLMNGTGVVGDRYEQTSRNYAFFTHNVISLVPDKLLLTVGARYTNEKKTLDTAFNHSNTFCAALRNSSLVSLAALPCVINGTAGTGFTTATDPGATKGEDKFTGTVVLSFKPTEKLLTYASFSRGYKAGGYNLDTSALDASCNPANPSAAVAAACQALLAKPANTAGNGRPEAADLRFEPEIVNAYEIGVKLDLHDIKINASAFYEAFNNFQLNTFNGVNFEVTNVSACKDSLSGADTDLSATTGACASNRTKAGVVSKGVEIEAYFYPTRDLAVSTGMTVADTKYQKNLVGLNGVPLAPTLFQLPGSQLSNASKYVVTGSMAWTPQVSEYLSALAYADFRYQSKINTGSDLDYEKFQKDFIIVNARLGLYGPGRRWGVELWAQNLLNTLYQQVAADAPLQGGGTTAQTAKFGSSTNQLYITFPSEPRTFGVTVRTKF